jgi:hypothetical protein
MSESDHFLSRWSRRKQEATKQAALPAKEEIDDNQRADSPAEPMASRSETPATKSEPVFDLSKLPSLDSIGPETDISLFLQPGVPASLSHAALRRAWSADPAIRDFIGLSENSWDFTAPDSIPGFGPLLPVDDVKQMVARIFNDQTAKLLDPTIETSNTADAAPSTPEENSAQLQQGGGTTQRVVSNQDHADGVAEAPHHQTDLSQRNAENIASQQSRAIAEHAATPARRRHGGALPT